jgi:hypothetical protein
MPCENKPLHIPSELLHLTYDGNFQFERNTKALCCEKRISNNDKDDDCDMKFELILDGTAIHPQGEEGVEN